MKKFFISLSSLFIFIFLISFLRFSKGFYKIRSQKISHAGAIVALTGGKGRLLTALKLLETTQIKLLYIAGVEENVSLEAIFGSSTIQKTHRNQIVLEKISKSTYQNALYARTYCIEHGIDAIVLVTSTYHMQRALYIFESIFPENIEVIPYPIETDNFNLDDWWVSPIGLKLALSEYIKYLWYRGMRLGNRSS